MESPEYEDIPDTDFPSLFSDDEFEAVRHQRTAMPRSVHDRWDNKGIIDKPVKTDGRPESTIEQRFQRVANQLVAIWPSDACAL
jgi:hypothetical protein